MGSFAQRGTKIVLWVAYSCSAAILTPGELRAWKHSALVLPSWSPCGDSRVDFSDAKDDVFHQQPGLSEEVCQIFVVFRGLIREFGFFHILREIAATI
jgi:hypothetical protein